MTSRAPHRGELFEQVFDPGRARELDGGGGCVAAAGGEGGAERLAEGGFAGGVFAEERLGVGRGVGVDFDPGARRA